MKLDRHITPPDLPQSKPYKVATKTLQAIEDAFQADNGNLYRHYLRELLPIQEDIYRQEDESSRRGHLGASMIGRKCSRELWYGFRWAYNKRFSGRIQRLFNRGHMEEPRLVALLLMIGCKVWQITEDGKQYRILGYKGHYAGSLDGIVKGIPDMPNEPMLAEFKTYSKKQFDKLVANGVQAHKVDHVVQQNEYMARYKLNYSLYVAVCKDDDELHIEILPFNSRLVKPVEDKVISIIDSHGPPAKINESPGWWECKFCDAYDICHKGKPVAQNCRTCQYVRVENDGIWACVHPQNGGIVLTNEMQVTGCKHYTVNQHL